MNARKWIVSVLAGLLLTIAAQTAQAAVLDWQEQARHFSMLFASNSTVFEWQYYEDGSFYIEDEAGNTYTGCQVGMPCDDSMTSSVYLPTVSK